MKQKTASYRCPYCLKVVAREFDGEKPRGWIKSICHEMGTRDVRLQLVK